jgi:hypothetical protein
MGLGLLMAALATQAVAADLQWQAPSSDDRITDLTTKTGVIVAAVIYRMALGIIA